MPFRHLRLLAALSLPLLLGVILWRVNYWRPKSAQQLTFPESTAGDFALSSAQPGDASPLLIENLRSHTRQKIKITSRPYFSRFNFCVAPDGQSLSYSLSDDRPWKTTADGESWLWHNGKNRKIAGEMWISSTFSKDGKTLVVFDGGTLRGFEAQTAQNIWNWPIANRADSEQSRAFDADTSRFLIVGRTPNRFPNGYQFESWNWKTRQKTKREILSYTDLGYKLSPGGKWIYALNTGGGVRDSQESYGVTLVSTRDPKKRWMTMISVPESQTQGEPIFNRDESLFAIQSERKIFLFQCATGKLLRWLPKPTERFQNWCFSPDNSEIWSQSEDGKFWRQSSQ